MSPERISPQPEHQEALAVDQPQQPPTFFVSLLPGSDKKKPAKPYSYLLTFRNPDTKADGCLMLCEVQGGRDRYQVAIERDRRGKLQLHCTCPDAVYRAESEGRFCKHVLGLLAFCRQLSDDFHAPERNAG